MYKYRCQSCGHVQENNDSPQNIQICDKCGKVDIRLQAINLYKCHPYDTIKIMEQELLNRQYHYNNDTIDYYWKTTDGKIISIHDMTTDHLKNTIYMLKRRTGID